MKSAAMMSDLLELAVIRRIAEQERLRPPNVNRFDAEVEDVADDF